NDHKVFEVWKIYLKKCDPRQTSKSFSMKKSLEARSGL
ncbi:unnamed protein product, partial [Tenebrio molitor]